MNYLIVKKNNENHLIKMPNEKMYSGKNESQIKMASTEGIKDDLKIEYFLLECYNKGYEADIIKIKEISKQISIYENELINRNDIEFIKEIRKRKIEKLNKINL